jgi:excisionase family DNA binding protein
MLTTSDVAARLHCDSSTVRRWCKRESIGQRVGRDWLLTEADVKRLAELVQPHKGNPNFKAKS